MCRPFLAAATAVAALAAATPCLAGAPEPSRRIDINVMLGRWYEVARFPNPMQKGCVAGASEWKKAPDGYSVVQTCHAGDPSGPEKSWRAKAKVVDPATNAKIRMSFFGGVLNQEYWVLDHRSNEGWLILGTPGGNFLWLMSTRPTLSAAARASALARIRQLGYDVGRLEFPRPAAAD